MRIILGFLAVLFFTGFAQATDYVHQTDGVIDVAPRTLPASWGKHTGLTHASDETLKGIGWLPVTYINKVYTPATQVRTGPTGANYGDPVGPDAVGVTSTYTVRQKTAEELAAYQHAQDVSTIKTSVDKLAYILTELVKKLLEQETILPTDFTAPVIQFFQDLKFIVDRAKP